MRLSYKDIEQLNILFVSHDAYPAGAQYLLLALTSWLKESGLVNPRFILGPPWDLYEDFLRIGPVLRLDLALQKGQQDEERNLRTLRSFCSGNVSAVYLNSAASGHISRLTRRLNVPQVAHIHELEKSIERWAGPEKMSALREHARLFIAASKPVAANLYKNHGILRKRLKVVPAFIKCTGVRQITDQEKRDCKSALGLNPEAKIVLGCGTTDGRKGPDLFVEIAEKLSVLGYREPVQFVWVGGETETGQINRLEQLSAEKGLKNIVSFIGAVEMPLPYMIASDIFLLPSREDPFPLVCLEAADCGLPILCFAEAGGMPDFVGSGCGAVVPYLDVAQMAEAVRSFLTSDVKTRQFGDRARARVRRRFDVSVQGQEIYEILKALCGDESAGNGGSSNGNGNFLSNGSGNFKVNEKHLISEFQFANSV